MSLQDEINKVKAEKEAIVQEFTTNLNSTSPDAIRKQLKELVPDAIVQLSHLVSHAESEGTRFAASKYVIEIARSSTSTDDALKKLLGDLTKAPTPTNETPTSDPVPVPTPPPPPKPDGED